MKDIKKKISFEESVETMIIPKKKVYNTYPQNLRDAANNTGVIIGVVPAGELDIEFSKEDKWVKYKEGWIETRFLEER